MDLQFVESVTDVPAVEWDILAGEDDPFLEHRFLAALEESGSVGERAGCVPRFVLAREHGRLVGAVPLYLKTNSYGEFIFDWSWADAAQRAGIRYYPKLVAAVPFTPVTGHRLLTAPDAARGAVVAELMRGVRRAADEERASSVHFLFCTDDEKELLAASGPSGATGTGAEADRYLPRLSMQFHWRNREERPYESFEDYLGAFRSRSRKQVRKERQVAASHGLTFRTVSGSELDARDWEALHRFYVANVRRHHGIAYLKAPFFEIARQTMGQRLVATLAYRGAEPVAGTVNFEKGKHLYGRYWGCSGDWEMLHFELCYYRLIERAIERRYTLFEAGAQGEHKLKRGLVPAYTHSAHWLRHPQLAEAISAFVQNEAEAVAEQARLYADHSPFRAADDTERDVAE